jgi:hypothetical protein
MLRELIGSLVWLAANGLYIDMRRKGRRGFARIIFFWMGNPATWLWLFLVPEGKKPELPPPADDFDHLLEEIRRDRALSGGGGTTAGETPPVSGDGEGEDAGEAKPAPE